MQLSASGGLGRALLSFTGALLLGQILIVGIGMLFPKFDMPSAMGLILVITAAMTGGQAFARATHRKMTAGEKLRFALFGTVIGLVLSAVGMFAMFAWYGVPLTLDTLSVAMTGDMRMAAELRPWLLTILAGSAVFSMLICFFAVGFGARGALRAIEKAAAQDAPKAV